MEKTRDNPLMLEIAVISIYAMAQVSLLVTPALSSFATIYTDVPYSTITFISTMVNVGLVFGTLLTGVIAGKYVRVKTCIIIGFGLVIISGVAPYFLPGGIGAVLVCRFIVGFGAGMVNPLGNLAVIASFKGKTQSRVLGIALIFQSICGIFYQLMAGIVCTINPQYTWLIHLILLIPFIFAFMLKEPEEEQKNENKQEKTVSNSSKKEHIPFAYWMAVLGFTLIMLSFYPTNLGMSLIITGEGIGDAAMAGLVISFFSVGGIAGGALYPILKNHLGWLATPIGLAMYLGGMLCASFGHNPIVLSACMFLIGGAGNVVGADIIALSGEIVPQSRQAMSLSLWHLGMSAASFISSPMLALIASIFNSTNPRIAVYVGTVSMAIVTVIWALVCVKNRNKNSESNDSYKTTTESSTQ